MKNYSKNVKNHTLKIKRSQDTTALKMFLNEDL